MSGPGSGASAFRRERDAKGVLVLTLDLPGEKLNTLGKGLIAEFDEILDEIGRDDAVRAVVVRSGKPDSFVAGADIKDFTRIRSAEEGEALSRAAHAVFDRVEGCRVPVVAAIHGTCLGGGTELALACRYRVASDDPKTAIGLPEVMLGLVPGAGGTQRLPRLVGLATALDLILSGRTLKGGRAAKAGLVDEVCPAPILLDVAKRAALGLAEGRLVPKRPGVPLRERLLRPVVFWRAKASVLAKTAGHYPAPLAAVELVKQGTATSQAEGLKLEAKAFGALATGDVSRSLVSVFFATQEIKKDAGYPAGTKASEVQKLGVLGAGLMGAGIAGAAADAGIAVRMKDATLEALGRGLGHVRGIWDERRQRRRLTPLEVRQRTDRISPTLDYSGFRRADLVIEAVFEDQDLKRRVLAETEAATRDECVFASNTSSIPIGDIARGCRRPSQVLGMHFFSPVHKMPLLEVVATPETAPAAIATAETFGRRIGKHVIVVRDGPGFYTSRALAAYINEATWLLEEGAPIDGLDRAMTAFGFPVGPVTLLDEVGIDVGAKVAKVMHQHFADRMPLPPSMESVLAEGRLGRKSKKGFYTYDGRRKRVDESAYALLPAGAGRLAIDAREVQERLLSAFLNESVRCLQEGILRSPRDGDVGAIYGLGFPPFLGGPFRYLDR
ncbi:MAG TPA: 3-hydroxyacyl-CoA dehydrogenase NAD-binding domain-containing protein, partial [Vicinamibacteria bacterium]|nr:3-hydroxyacyl-CoA dehydrogenase NAD-binding domain-containing protein [Vicinamibacteria bacterium]